MKTRHYEEYDEAPIGEILNKNMDILVYEIVDSANHPTKSYVLAVHRKRVSRILLMHCLKQKFRFITVFTRFEKPTGWKFPHSVFHSL